MVPFSVFLTGIAFEAEHGLVPQGEVAKNWRGAWWRKRGVKMRDREDFNREKASFLIFRWFCGGIWFKEGIRFKKRFASRKIFYC